MRAKGMTYKAIGLALGVSHSLPRLWHREMVRMRERGWWCELTKIADECASHGETRALMAMARAGYRTLAEVHAADDQTILRSRSIGKTGLRTLRTITGPKLDYEETA